MQRGVPWRMVRDYAGHKNFGRSYQVDLPSWWPTVIWNLHSFFAMFCDAARSNFELYPTLRYRVCKVNHPLKMRRLG